MSFRLALRRSDELTDAIIPARFQSLYKPVQLRLAGDFFPGLWRPVRLAATGPVRPRPAAARAIDPTTGWLIVTISFCIEPQAKLALRQAAKVDALKAASSDFTTTRAFSMRFLGILRAATSATFHRWPDDARASGIYAIMRIVRRLRLDIAAVRSVITETWSHGQTEGRINRLKALRRAIHRQASVELLRARMMPFNR